MRAINPAPSDRAADPSTTIAGGTPATASAGPEAGGGAGLLGVGVAVTAGTRVTGGLADGWGTDGSDDATGSVGATGMAVAAPADDPAGTQTAGTTVWVKWVHRKARGVRPDR
jgi:hypothetical protein